MLPQFDKCATNESLVLLFRLYASCLSQAPLSLSPSALGGDSGRGPAVACTSRRPQRRRAEESRCPRRLHPSSRAGILARFANEKRENSRTRAEPGGGMPNRLPLAGTPPSQTVNGGALEPVVAARPTPRSRRRLSDSHCQFADRDRTRGECVLKWPTASTRHHAGGPRLRRVGNPCILRGREIWPPAWGPARPASCTSEWLTAGCCHCRSCPSGGRVAICGRRGGPAVPSPPSETRRGDSPHSPTFFFSEPLTPAVPRGGCRGVGCSVAGCDGWSAAAGWAWRLRPQRGRRGPRRRRAQLGGCAHDDAALVGAGGGSGGPLPPHPPIPTRVLRRQAPPRPRCMRSPAL